MASLGHIVVGMAAARVHSRDAVRIRPALAAMLFWAALSFLTDADVTPLPVSPIGLGYLSQYGLYVAAAEIILFAPLLRYALAGQDAPPAAGPRRPMPLH